MIPLIELCAVSFGYRNDALIIDQVDLALHEKQRIGLIGPNGSGKTTLFNLIMGLVRPRCGHLYFRGHPLTKEKDFKVLRQDVGLLFQDADDQLFSPTVLEDIAFGPLNLGVSAEEARTRSLRVLEELGLRHLHERITHQLSGGEKKLVALATILVMEPSALLLDEPTNNLDPPTRERLIDILAGLDLATIVISHDYDFLAATCRDTRIMENGKVLIGEPSSLHTHYHIHRHGSLPHRHGDT
ncbi:energy-coupling factor ABC transporter ATP-binding protein [Desulfofustis limnaeus]|jgi:cobalt/nickel transport system ATP-binding protein|uniref:ABC transporter ATP-binding protein n=1 Tax=Desulfofustis limnaeus TaxID=2740163 RepID=A0ABM7W6C6_9BACT|nr:energy-coupling factor ABC transporter ATP-binding protein [Desulfofustis limnaeus]MDX9895732.1 energy-coupling factor ABC transporter ATP-binding protein [Desulfofustis sp.]BDD86468.1 putative ABC transporter ATP-binding protein [Desulfofustis limnaeus]